MTTADIWRLVAVAALIAMTGLFVAAEYAMVAARKSRIDAMAKKGSRFALRASKAMDHLPQYIAGLQVCITMTGLALGAVGESFLAGLVQRWLATTVSHIVATIIALLFITFFTVTIGEVVPKYVALQNPNRWAVRLVLPIYYVLAIVRPLTVLLEGAARLILKPLKIDFSKRHTVMREELPFLISEGADAGELQEEHARVITRALRLTDLQADDVMVPRVDIGFINVDCDSEQLAKKVSDLRHTRLVVVEDDDLDEIVGILHLPDAMRMLSDNNVTVRELTRPAVFVPPNVKLDRLIEIMRTKRTQVLIVRDEHGGTEGLLTLEDIVEEIFGELDDQIESSAPRIERRSDGRIVMRADVRTDELCEFLGLEENPMERESVTTIIHESLNRTPRLGDTVQTPLGMFRVDNMTQRRVTKVSLMPTQQ